MKILLHNSKYYRSVVTPLYTGWQEVPKDEIEIFQGVPRFRWTGGKISFELWGQVVSFLRWTQEKFGEEAMMLFFYNTTTHQWAAWPFPQEPNGMTIRLLHNDPQYAADRTKFGNGWIQAGTIHHHCKAGAFQSGTDNMDEMNRDGIHITLGKLDQQDLDVHVRSVFDSLMGDTSLYDWIEMPEWIKAAPKYAQLHSFSHAIRNVIAVPFPEEWKSRIIEKKAVVYSYERDPRITPPPGGGVGTQGTLLTMEAGSGAKGNASTSAGTPGSAGTEATTAATWHEKMELRLRDVLSRLGLSDAEALILLCQLPSHKPGKSEQERREALLEALKKDNIPNLYAEGILEKKFSAPHR